MDALVDRAMALWTAPVAPAEAGLAAFGAVYADPLSVNGQPTPLQALVDRARMLQGALDGLSVTVHERFEAPGRRAFAFAIGGRHVGPLTTPLGDVPATGREVELAGQDIFVVDEDAGRVTAVWATADLLSALIQLGALSPGAVAAGAGRPAG